MMDMEDIKWKKSEKTKSIWYLLYAESKKYSKLVDIRRKEQTQRYRELVVTSEEGEGQYEVGEGR